MPKSKGKASPAPSNPSLDQQVELQFRDYVLYGKSLRQISRKWGIPWETLRDKFKRKYGKDFAKMKGKEGSLLSVLREHLAAYPPNSKEYKTLYSWFQRNSEILMEQHRADVDGERCRLLTHNQVVKESLLFVVPGDFDLRDSPYLQYRDELDPLSRLIQEEQEDMQLAVD